MATSGGSPSLTPTAAASDDFANPTAPSVLAMLMGYDGATWDRIRSLASDADGLTAALTTLLASSRGYGFNGATWDRLRVANVYKNIAGVAITAGTPATIWTPAAGKKVRLLGYALTCSVAAVYIFKYAAAGTEFLRAPSSQPFYPTISPPMGNGIMPGVADDVLKLDVTVNGTVHGHVFGVEE